MFSHLPGYSIVATCLTVFAVTYYLCTRTFGIWERLNVPYVRPIPLFGNFFKVAIGSQHPIDFYRTIYDRFAGHQYAGLFQMRTPYLMIRDPELVNTVLITDFSHFPDRGIHSDFSANPLSNNLFFMDNPQWKVMRYKLSQAFTSVKLKSMYGQMKECSDELIKNIQERLAKNRYTEMDVRDVMGNYSTDVIGTCSFGLKLNTINNDGYAFRTNGKKILEPSLRQKLRELILLINPALLKIIKIKDFPADACMFFNSAFQETMAYREKNNIVRNDVVQALIKAKHDLVYNAHLLPEEQFTETQIVANAFIMFIAGFEPVASAMSFCLYELALRKDIQDKLREEIKLQKFKNNGVVDSNLLVDLIYLDMVLAETLRKHPPTFALFRKASQAYHLPNDSLVIEKGQKIIIPIYSLHYDEQYFPDPEVFDPERFSLEEKAKRPSGTYLPFGDGPRICIGKRFAEIEIKLAIVDILSKFEVEPCEKTEIPLKISNKTVVVMPENGVWLKFIEIST